MFMKKLIACFLIIILILGTSAGCKKKVKEALPDSNKIAQNHNGNGDGDKASGEKDARTNDNLWTSFTTGMKYAGQNDKLFAVMIENTPPARPQSGLIYADVVYEALVEGGITRFLALFYENYPDKVGPVRSARPYFVDIAEEWNAQYIHVGGSEAAKSAIKQLGLIDIDALHMSRPFFKDKTRVDPHATYVSLKDAAKLNDVSTDKNPHFKFDSDTPRGDVKSVEVKYNRYFDDLYKFDENTGHFLRYINGKPHMDRETGKQLYADNIILQYAPYKVVDSEGRLYINLISKGKAAYIINGNYIEGTWERTSKADITHFYDNNGEEIRLMPGKTWINIVPSEKSVTVNK